MSSSTPEQPTPSSVHPSPLAPADNDNMTDSNPLPASGTLPSAPPKTEPSSPLDLNSETHLHQLVDAHQRLVLNFYADWAPPCVQMNSVFEALAAATNVLPQRTPPPPQPHDDYLHFVRVNAEHFPAVAAAYAVDTVPCFVLLHRQRVVARVEGADPPTLAKRVQWLADPATTNELLENAALVYATSQRDVMLFLKGTPDDPKCRFSRQIVDLLNASGVVYGHCDVLKDQWLREALKKLHNWPTYPQLYAKGKLIGGLDIVRELVDSGELLKELSNHPAVTEIGANTEHAVAQSTTAASVVADIDKTNLLGNGIKDAASSHAPHFEHGASANQSGDLEKRLQTLVTRAPVMLFMKGRPDAPRCGFSRQIVHLLREQGIAFESFDILEDPEVRQGLKDLFQWPTYPQLYSNGNLIGGLDIVQELVQSASLKSELGLADETATVHMVRS